MKPLDILRQPKLSNIAKYFANKGLVGEEKISILQTLMAIKRVHFGIESLSGAGKSATMDLLANKEILGEDILLPPDYVYVMSMGSRTSQFYKANEINKAKLIYIEELQKAGASLEVAEMIKNLAEGKNYTRDVTDATTKTVNTQLIEKGKGIMYTLALENKHKTDAEMKRRFMVLTTDVSQPQTRRVITRKSKERFAKERLLELKESDIAQLKTHIKMCMDKAGDFKYQNPFAEAITDFMPTPDQKVRSFVDHFLNVVEAITLFNYKERHKNSDGEIFVNLEDVWMANLLYGEFFNKDIHGIPALGMEILKAFNDLDYENTLSKKTNLQKGLGDFTEEVIEHRWATITDIHKHLKSGMKIVLTHAVTRDICNLLYDSGYLERNTGTKITEYHLVENPEGFVDSIDWEEVYHSGVENMSMHRKDDLKEWMDLQSLVFENPVTKEQINILDTKVEDYDKPVTEPSVKKVWKTNIEEEIILDEVK